MPATSAERISGLRPVQNDAHAGEFANPLVSSGGIINMVLSDAKTVQDAAGWVPAVPRAWPKESD